MTNPYSNGKIYKLKGNGLEYYGSTIQSLQKRYRHHLNNITSNVAEMIGDDFQIELVEDYPCNTKEQLLEREAFWIMNNNCVNTRMSNKTKDYIRRKQLMNKIYKLIPSRISKKLNNYLDTNDDININTLLEKIINPVFL